MRRVPTGPVTDVKIGPNLATSDGNKAAMIGAPHPPTLETPRLILRGWQQSDLSAFAAMMADAETARFITRRGLPYGEREAWSEMAFHAGHWQLLGFGQFVIEERAGGRFVGRAGPLRPKGWLGFEIAWALAPEARGNGYATEAAAAAIGWAFERFGLERIISVIDPRNHASRKVAERLGERRTGETFAPFGHPCDVWELPREEWRRR